LLIIATLKKLLTALAVTAVALAKLIAKQKIELLKAQVNMLTQELRKQVDLIAKK
jgi:hypothetical protein